MLFILFVIVMFLLFFAVFGILSAIPTSQRSSSTWIPGAIVSALVLVALIWAVTPILIPQMVESIDSSWRDQMHVFASFGDMFGATTSLFSGLAFLGLIATLVMQGRELSLQREDLKLNRKELSLTRGEVRLQRFENTLFGLIRQLNEHVLTMQASFGYMESSEIFAGRRYIKEIAESLPDQFYGRQEYIDDHGKKKVRQYQRELCAQIEEYEEIFSRRLEADFAPYMRLLYGIFRHIETAKITEDQRKMYSRFVRAQLSSAELKFILFDCASGVGKDFQDWIVKYGLLKHLPKSTREANPNLVSIYPEGAFELIPVPHVEI